MGWENIFIYIAIVRVRLAIVSKNGWKLHQVVFCGYRRSYLLWSPVIVTSSRSKTKNKNMYWITVDSTSRLSVLDLARYEESAVSWPVARYSANISSTCFSIVNRPSGMLPVAVYDNGERVRILCLSRCSSLSGPLLGCIFIQHLFRGMIALATTPVYCCRSSYNIHPSTSMMHLLGLPT